MSLRRTPTLLLAGALALGLAACDTGASEPTAKPTTSASATSPPAETSSAPTEEPSTPAVPAPNPADYPGMDQQTEEGAKQAYKYFWDSYVYGRVTGDLAPLDDMSTRDCNWCLFVSDEVRKDQKLWETGSITPGELRIDPPDAKGTPVYYQFELTGAERKSPNNPNPESVEAEPMIAASHLVWIGDRWQVAGVDVSSQGA